MPFLEWISQPWPWYVAGPLIGLVVPALLLVSGRPFGLSTSFEDMCAATLPAKPELLRRDWKQGSWRLSLVAGIALGGLLTALAIPNPEAEVAISAATRADLEGLGLTTFSGLAPTQIFSWESLGTVAGFVIIVLGGYMVGFGSRYASGCTSGHAIMGLANLQVPSLLAVLGFFAGGLTATWLILPALL
ncbi:MAG: YeeE/YedE family protein [Gemmatimonadota bacterium]|nr:YeeE/YedE family protein [Gemmatimonadota bacterium]